MADLAATPATSKAKSASGKRTPRNVLTTGGLSTIAQTGPTRIQQMCQHGAIALSGPAALNRTAVPGPGSYQISPRVDEILKPTNKRVPFDTRPRFLKEGALFDASAESKVPGPGSYDAHDQLRMGMYKVGKAKKEPSWKLTPRPMREWAKVTC
eukprot:TRINITY_DN66832_c0_g1_i1.p1 TRINITY_DN66832_c0_g1~~TRINITY_DN66832_c0_g1_i1.p1  ORF type:complete len:170 (-),score=30.13 TRINITY_DN66832_c0_g1_i1:310-771(-)